MKHIENTPLAIEAQTAIDLIAKYIEDNYL